MIDFSQGFARKVGDRLGEEQIIWMTTVDASNTPQPRPVWYYFDGQSILLFSRPERAKVRHIRANPHVSVNLNSDFRANQVTVLIGQAAILDEQPTGPRLQAYVEKYLEGMRRLDHTPESFLGTYSTPIEITLDRVRGF